MYNQHYQSMSINRLTASMANQQPQRSAAGPEHKIGRAQHTSEAAGPQLQGDSCRCGYCVCGFFSFQLAPSSESFRFSPSSRLSQLFWLVIGRQAGWFGCQAAEVVGIPCSTYTRR